MMALKCLLSDYSCCSARGLRTFCQCCLLRCSYSFLQVERSSWDLVFEACSNNRKTGDSIFSLLGPFDLVKLFNFLFFFDVDSDLPLLVFPLLPKPFFYSKRFLGGLGYFFLFEGYFGKEDRAPFPSCSFLSDSCPWCFRFRCFLRFSLLCLGWILR